MKKFLYRAILAILMCQFLTLGIPSGTMADDFPSKNIKLFVGYKPGGGFDTYTRAIAQQMQKYLPSGVNVIVVNRPGAASQIAATAIYNAKPDGYTIGIWPMPGLYIPQMFFETKYDVNKVTWLGTVLVEPMVLAVSPKSKFRSIKELQASENVRVTLTGFTGPEIAAPITMEKLGIKAQFITGHKGSGEAMLAAIRGDGDAVVYTCGSIRKFAIKKQLIPLLLMGADQRSKEFPDVPTATEAGYPELDEAISAWRSFGCAPGVPENRVKYLRDLFWKIMNSDDFKKWSEKSKREISPKTGDQTKAGLQKVLKRYDDYKPLMEKYIK